MARYEPGNPLADADGYVYAPNVNVVEEMVDMISASRSYQNNVEVMNTSKELLLATLRLGQSERRAIVTGVTQTITQAPSRPRPPATRCRIRARSDRLRGASSGRTSS